MKSLRDVPEPLKREIEHFFSVYKDLEEKKVEVEGWESRERWRGLQEDDGS